MTSDRMQFCVVVDQVIINGTEYILYQIQLLTISFLDILANLIRD